MPLRMEFLNNMFKFKNNVKTCKLSLPSESGEGTTEIASNALVVMYFNRDLSLFFLKIKLKSPVLLNN